MSARAAWRLQTLGFAEVYRYTQGKMDWFGRGLPRAGESAKDPQLGDLANRDVPVCQLDEPVEAVRRRLAASLWDVCVVVTEPGQVVLGIVRAASFPADEIRIEQIMESGPITYRPSATIEDAQTYFEENDPSDLLITTNDGQLVGYLTTMDVQGIQPNGRVR